MATSSSARTMRTITGGQSISMLGRTTAGSGSASASSSSSTTLRLPLPSSARYLSSSSSPGAGARRTVSSSFLLASSRHIVAARHPTTFALAGSTRSLSLWPFSRSQQPQPSQEAVSSAETHVQQTAHDAKESLASTASDAQQTIVNTAADISHKTTEVAHNVQEGVVSSSQAVSQLVSTVASGGELPHTPTFTELGLGTSWWPPTGWLQIFLDYMTSTTGLPWWATIIGTTVTLRFCLAPLLIYVQGNTIRLANIQPKLQNIMNDISHAKATGDMASLQAQSQRAQQLFRENNCHPLRSFLLPLVQMPIFVSFFFALRGMASAGLPSLKDGGLGWFTDLTLADPYYILPVASSALTLLVLETGAETGTNSAMANPQMKVMKNVLRGFLGVATFFILDFPTAVLLYWVTNNSFSLLQLLALRTRFLRTRLNLPERIVQPPAPVTLTAGSGGYRAAPVASKDVGFWQGIKQGMDSVKGMDAQRRANAPTALRRPASAAEEGGSSVAAVARDRALKALYEQGGMGATANAGVSDSAASPPSTLSGSAGVSPGEVMKGMETEERNARIQHARARRAARRRI
ncbi:hypothetical protein A4X09_0g2220 [Tilletia walkeri]|uniref:Membrane insertase YidC/Oxa/ALB C-terminal domain-containing protein n=1 Tax=Tilletia walkeri TaxID=117179 RepID=A0A8X7T605_9BASI|nr:hypothetical protein A4X09_0g2220 [Tilletia walkeri]